MNRYSLILIGVGLAAALTQSAVAQPAPGEPPVGSPPPAGVPPAGLGNDQRPQIAVPPNPILMVLDVDHDGELSEAEISNAAVALRTLDQNGDGKLSRVELHPFQARPDPRERLGETLRERPPLGTPSLLVQRLMGMDKDGDGKVSRNEAPEGMQNFDRIDTNKDGFIDRTEAQALADRVRPRGAPRPGGPEQPARPELHQ